MIRGVITEAKAYKPFDQKTSKGLYLSVVPDSRGLDFLAECGNALGLDLTAFDLSELHCTVVYSKAMPENVEALPLDKAKVYSARLVGVEWWPGHDDAGYCVARVQCPALVDLHNEWLGYGCSRGYEQYNPHMTLKKDAGPMPSDFYSRKKALFKYIGTSFNLGNATIEGLKK